MKKILLILSITILLTFCCGCYEAGDAEVIYDQFVVISSNFCVDEGTLYTTYDKDSKVMYYITWAPYRCTISPIYNADGSVKIYKE